MLKEIHYLRATGHKMQTNYFLPTVPSKMCRNLYTKLFASSIMARATNGVSSF